MDLDLRGKTAFVSGASGGIGQAIARQLVAEGARVLVHYRANRASAETLVEELGADSAMAVAADLSQPSQVKSAFESATRRWPTIDILVANAGVWPVEHVPVKDMSLEQWQGTLSTNLTSTFLSCREFLRHVESAKVDCPAIVLIGSTAAVFGEAGHGDYAASKSGLAYGLMLTLKNEIPQIAPRGRVNTVCPGWTVTPMAEKFTGDGSAIRRALSTIAMRKVAAADDIASTVVFLCSSRAAGHISGQVLTVSGGMEGRKLYDDDQLDVSAALPSP